jgi:hypothetical protein
MNKAGIITTGVFSSLTAIGCLVAGIVILQSWDDETSECPVLFVFESDDYYDAQPAETGTCDFVTWAVLTFLACALWTAITVGIFAFACSNRLEKSEHADYPDQAQGVELTATATASAMATPISSGFASVPTVTYLPDGTQKTEMAVANPDGSITIQTTFDNVAKIDAKV